MLSVHRAAPGASLGARGARGFTLVELMVTIALFALLVAMAMPSFTAMMRNNRVRTVSEALMNGVRLAQAEAVRRSRQTVFSLTNDEPGIGSTAVVNGSNWAIHTIPPVLAGEAREFIQGGAFPDIAPGVTIAAADAAICFNSMGRLANNDAPNVGGAVCAGTPARFDVSAAGSDRPLRVLVALGGQVRLCDPNKTLSAATPEGCPP